MIVFMEAVQGGEARTHLHNHGGTWPWIRQSSGRAAPIVKVGSRSMSKLCGSDCKDPGLGLGMVGVINVEGPSHGKENTRSPAGRVRAPGDSVSTQVRVNFLPRLSSSFSYSPQVHFIGVACGLPWTTSECWGGMTSGDRRSFIQVVKKKSAPVIMVLP
jgi:hypothetical protein